MQAETYAVTIAILLSVQANKRMIMLTEDTPFIPRAISYFAHLFPFRDDGTTLAFGRDEHEYTKIAMMDDHWLSSLVFSNDKRERLNITKKKIGIRDHLIWRDHPMHSIQDADADTDAATVFHMANPALRKTEYDEQMCTGDYQDFQGYRIVQFYVDKGFPFEVPCHSCLQQQSGLTTSYHIFPLRDISKAKPILALRLEEASHSKNIQVPYLAWALKITNEVMNHHGAALVQFVGRATGSHTEISFQHIVEDDHGRLQVHPPNYLIKELKMGTEGHKTSANKMKELTSGLTITCGQHVDNEVRGIGFIYNIDYLTNGKNNEKLVLNYDKFESANTFMMGLPYVDHSSNLKLDITWDEWSCCSACCCSGTICGFYTTNKDCHKMKSYRVRRGYLSVYINNWNLPLNIKNMEAGDELNELFRLSPYREKGIAVFSSLLVNTQRFRIGFFDNELKNILIKYFRSREIELDKYEGLGMFTDVKSCANDTEKTNCTVLAKCRRMEVEQIIIEREDKLPEDPCRDLELITLVTHTKRMSFKVEIGENYRFRIAGVDMDSNIEKVTWKISQTVVKNYNAAKNCSDQGKVLHENKFDLLVLNISSVDIGTQIEAFLSNGSSFVIDLFDKKSPATPSSYKKVVPLALGVVMSM